jgi:hypothetical protein
VVWVGLGPWATEISSAQSCVSYFSTGTGQHVLKWPWTFQVCCCISSLWRCVFPIHLMPLIQQLIVPVPLIFHLTKCHNKDGLKCSQQNKCHWFADMDCAVIFCFVFQYDCLWAWLLKTIAYLHRSGNTYGIVNMKMVSENVCRYLGLWLAAEKHASEPIPWES